ncbi:hypothetical protein [Pseudomonas sp. Teo4]|uniref:hypothetical protein n=1 Tax=Pseudomonas sp. Teo4 TaxID=3064528 RepID=UPI002ACB0D33|nr:hypothetical protein [Pseudomonas sp. Teo4]
MNHAKMVKGLAEQAVEPPVRQPLVVGGFDISTLDLTQHHCNVEAQERYADQPCLASL